MKRNSLEPQWYPTEKNLGVHTTTIRPTLQWPSIQPEGPLMLDQLIVGNEITKLVLGILVRELERVLEVTLMVLRLSEAQDQEDYPAMVEKYEWARRQWEKTEELIKSNRLNEALQEALRGIAWLDWDRTIPEFTSFPPVKPVD